jgi:phage terminase small subunit
MAERKAAPGPKQAPRASSQRSKAKDQQTPDNLPSRDLNPRQRAFVVEYLKDKNATQAYMRAYGVGAASAERAGPRLLGNVVVRSEIVRLETEALSKVQRDTGITLERTLREIAKGAFYDARKFFDDKGELRRVTDLDDDTASALAGFEVTEEFHGRGEDRELAGYTKKVKLADRKGYLDMLMKHLGGYKEDNSQRKDSLAEQLGAFLAQIHESGAGRLPIAPRKAGT